MTKIIDDDHLPLWIASDPIPASKLDEANQKVNTFRREHELTPPYPERFGEEALIYARALQCPVVAYPVEGRHPDEWGAFLFYEVQDGDPRPDTDLLLGFPNGSGTAFVVTRRGTIRIRSHIICN